MDDLNILFVGYRDNNHSSAGGYDKITNFPDADSLMGENVPFGFIPVGQKGKFLNLFFLDLYTRFRENRYDIVHYFYGEMLKRVNLRKGRTCKVVATIHMNVDHEKVRLINKLREIDGVISLSSWQSEMLKSEYGINATFVPHGFDKPSFTFKELGIDKEMINIVVSGKNYRNREQLIRTIEFCNKNSRTIRFHLLGQSDDIKRIVADFDNVICYPRLSDNDYFSVISSCDYNFLPLTFATANNALLEAEFLGVKSILPAITGISDYAAPAPLNMFYNTDEELFELLLSLNKCSKSDELITYSNRFLWSNIYNELMNYYKSL